MSITRTMSKTNFIDWSASTDPSNIDSIAAIERARTVSVEQCKQNRRRQLAAMKEPQLHALQVKKKALRTELKYTEIEENIIICRFMLDVKQDEPENLSAAKVYLDAAIPVFQRYMDKMTKLRLINAKINKPPQLPITFTEKEISELYRWLIKHQSIDEVVARAISEFTRQKTLMLEKLKGIKVGAKEWQSIPQAIAMLCKAAEEWRPAAELAIRLRCAELQGFFADDLIEEYEGVKADIGDKGVLVSDSMKVSGNQGQAAAAGKAT